MALTDGPDLSFLGRQIERLVTDVASLRDDMRVLTAITMRIDGQLGRTDAQLVRTDSVLAALLEETRATHAQIARMNDRIRKLEDTP
jgi:chromosome segregation ATPase